MTKNTATHDPSATLSSPSPARRGRLGGGVLGGRPWRSLAVVGLIGLSTTAVALPSGTVAAVDVAHIGALTQVWSQTLPDAGAPIALSSPNVATLAGGPAVVVGDRAGNVDAFSLATGA